VAAELQEAYLLHTFTIHRHVWMLRLCLLKFEAQLSLPQMQAVMGKFAAPKEGSNSVITDEAELQRHQQLEKLNASTTNTKVRFFIPAALQQETASSLPPTSICLWIQIQVHRADAPWLPCCSGHLGL
jgi:hypothetical protein